MALAVFYKVVLPILEVLLTVLIMISTLVDAWNFFSRTLDKGEEEMRSGKPRIVVFRQRLICDRCLAKKNGGTDCNHCEDDVPPWKQGTTRDLVKIIMGEENEDVFKRESMGVLANSLHSIFPLAISERLISDPWYDRREDIKPTHIFVGFDPNGGGLSHSAIVALARIKGEGTLIVCGLDSLQTFDTSQAKQFIVWFIGQLRLDWWLKDAEIIYACENNGLTFGLMEEVMAAVPNSRTVYEKPGGKPGIFTDGHKKNAYSVYLRQELNRGAVRFLRDFATCHGMPAGGKNTIHGSAMTEADKRSIIRRELFEQTKRAKPSSRPYTSDLRPRVIGWSAKCNADGDIVPGMNDDLLLVLCIGLFVLRAYEQRSSLFTAAQWGLPGESTDRYGPVVPVHL